MHLVVSRGGKDVLFFYAMLIGVTAVKNFNPEPAIELWWNDAVKLGEGMLMGQTKDLNWLRQIDNKMSLLSISLLLTICTTSVEL